MPHRTSEPRELCTVCSADADSACRRCQAPRCSEHALAHDRRCERCEVYFSEVAEAELAIVAAHERGERYTEVRPFFMFLPFLIFAMLFGLAAIGNSMLLLWSLGTLGAGAFITARIGPVIPDTRATLKRKRHQFLLERKRPPRQLPDGS